MQCSRSERMWLVSPKMALHECSYSNSNSNSNSSKFDNNLNRRSINFRRFFSCGHLSPLAPVLGDVALPRCRLRAKRPQAPSLSLSGLPNQSLIPPWCRLSLATCAVAASIDRPLHLLALRCPLPSPAPSAGLFSRWHACGVVSSYEI